MYVVSFINSLDDYATTSSCSGRISIYRHNRSNKGVQWLMVAHQTVKYEDIYEVVLKEIENRENEMLYIKCEGFILHVLCKDIESAIKLHQLALYVGYRESGVTLSQSQGNSDAVGNGKQKKSTALLAIRSTAFTLEIPVLLQGKPLITFPKTVRTPNSNDEMNGLKVVVDECNSRLEQNFRRVDKLLYVLKRGHGTTKGFSYPQLHKKWPKLDNDAVVPIPRSRYGHSVCSMGGHKLISMGGTERNSEADRGFNDNQVSTSSGGPSRRSKDAEILAFVNDTPIVVGSADKALDTEYMYAASTAFSRGVLHIGGRKAPVENTQSENNKASLSDYCFLRVYDSGMATQLNVLEMGDIPSSTIQRWGVTVTRLDAQYDEVYNYDKLYSEEELKLRKDVRCDKYVVIGGKTVNGVCSEHYLLERLDIEYVDVMGGLGPVITPEGGSWKWTRLEIRCEGVVENCPLQRFHHATCLLNSAPYELAVLIHGGYVPRSNLSAGSNEVSGLNAHVVDHRMFILYPCRQGNGPNLFAIAPEFINAYSNIDKESGGGSESTRASVTDMYRAAHMLTCLDGKCILMSGGIRYDLNSTERLLVPPHGCALDGLKPNWRNPNDFFCLDVINVGSLKSSSANEMKENSGSMWAIHIHRVEVTFKDEEGNGGGSRAHHQCVYNNQMQLRITNDSTVPVIALMGGGAPCLSFGSFFNASEVYYVTSAGNELPDDTCQVAVASSATDTSKVHAVDARQPVKTIKDSFSENNAPDSVAAQTVVAAAYLVCTKQNTKTIKTILEKYRYYDKSKRITKISWGLSKADGGGTDEDSEAPMRVISIQSMNTGSWVVFDESECRERCYAIPITKSCMDELTLFLSACMPIHCDANSAMQRHPLCGSAVSIRLDVIKSRFKWIIELYPHLCVDNDRASSTVSATDGMNKATHFLIFGHVPSGCFVNGNCPRSKLLQINKYTQCYDLLDKFYNEYFTKLELDSYASDIKNRSHYFYPKKFEIIGSCVLMIPLGSYLHDHCFEFEFDENRLWSNLLACFNCNRLARKSEIGTTLKRESLVKLLYEAKDMVLQHANYPDDSNTWVTVVENKIKFSFDFTKVMFCSGNCTERMRMGKVICKDEVIFDCYCGIGYYSVPLLSYGGARHINLFEWNPNSIKALKWNLENAHIPRDRYTITQGDNRITIPQFLSEHPDAELADRVLLGLLPSSQMGWHLGVMALKSSGGMIHIHENVHSELLGTLVVKHNSHAKLHGGDKVGSGADGSEQVKSLSEKELNNPEILQEVYVACATVNNNYWPDILIEHFTNLFNAKDEENGLNGLPDYVPMKCSVKHVEIVKSYAPRVYHVVVDMYCWR